MTKPSENDLIQAAQALGQATVGCPPEEREQIKNLYSEVQTFAESQKNKGVEIDRSAFFAAGLLFHPNISNEAVMDAAVKYIDLDLLFVKNIHSA